ncbi:MAG: hypothetical protein MUC77_00625 [Chromatiaceae bacterium]|nr:hypothetical protein [Chromatiaceae bacterium]
MGSDTPPISRLRSGRTYWVRRTPPPSAEAESATASPPKRPPGKRFVEPYRLSDEQRAAIIAPLAELGVGDAESRELFAAAMEYDLAGCRDLASPEPQPPARKPKPSTEERRLRALAEAAQALADQLAGLDPKATERLTLALGETDRFKRSYGDDYLRALRCELQRVAGAAPKTETGPAAPEPKPALPEPARRFVLRAADAFSDCFETKASAQRGSAFLATLQAIVAVTGVRIPLEPRTVAEILAKA